MLSRTTEPTITPTPTKAEHFLAHLAAHLPRGRCSVCELIARGASRRLRLIEWMPDSELEALVAGLLEEAA